MKKEGKNQEESGWVLIHSETDEFYGVVEWRDENGIMTGKQETVETNWKDVGYRFCKSGMGKLVLVK